jgi:predicted DNA-binding transcriptional regulator AlpA
MKPNLGDNPVLNRHDRRAKAATTKATADTFPAALENFDRLPDAANVRQPIVEALYACSSASVWRGVKSGRIPPPRKLSPRVTAWNVGALRRSLSDAG